MANHVMAGVGFVWITAWYLVLALLSFLSFSYLGAIVALAGLGPIYVIGVGAVVIPYLSWLDSESAKRA